MKKSFPFLILIIAFTLLGGCSNRNIVDNKTVDSNPTLPINNKNDSIAKSESNISPEWKKIIGNLYVPSKYSDLCGFGSTGECPEFSYENGVLPEKYQNNRFPGKGVAGNADMSLSVDDAMAGEFVINNEKVEIVVVPYFWSWASSGYGIYIVKKTNEIAEVIARIPTGKTYPKIKVISENKIKVQLQVYDDIAVNQNETCYFVDNKLTEEFLQCDVENEDKSLMPGQKSLSNSIILTDNQNNDRCYARNDKKCLTPVEQKIIKLLPNNAILREIVPVPYAENNIYIGIYIEDPVLGQTDPESKYLECFWSVRGQSISGIYHLFTYTTKITSDIVIPKSYTFNGDYNYSINRGISMSWKNTKINNFSYFHGKPYIDEEESNLEISTLINFEDLNGDGNPYEFILFGGEYISCGHDERLVAGYDEESLSAIIYKIKDQSGNIIYWKDNFIPNRDGTVNVRWMCGDHSAEQETNFSYQYDAKQKMYNLVKSEIKKCD